MIHPNHRTMRLDFAKTLVFASTLSLLLFTAPNSSSAQDTIRNEALTEHIRRFTLSDGRFTGAGASFLLDELRASDFVMIGEYHGSKRISEFTDALIPILSDVGFRTMMVEVGPSSGRMLDGLSGDIPSQLNHINNTYLRTSEDGNANLPIPFFNYVEDAAFLQSLKDRDWRLFGIDQEFLYGYPMQIDQLSANLDSLQRQSVSDLYHELRDSLRVYYEWNITGRQGISVSLKRSPLFAEFLNRTRVNPPNAEIIDHLTVSIDIYYLNDTRRWFESNERRVTYMKSMFVQHIREESIDLSREKILFKMGAFHLSRGFTPLAFYEIGNMVSELADFHQRKDLNITFSSRFYMENGEVKDILDSDNPFYHRTRELDKHGSMDEWVIIDLRPILKGYFYWPRIFDFNEHIIDMAKAYDLLIIPITETDPTPNYVRK
jgi:hypothetical protein